MSNVIELEKRGIRNEADLKRFVKHHANAEPGQLVQAINISLTLSVTTAAAAENHRLNAGRMLLELRAGIEAEGEDWWRWQDGKFRRSRKDMEKLMRLAGTENPEVAFEEEKASNAEQHRQRRNGADVRSKQRSNLQRIKLMIDALNDQGREQLRDYMVEKYQW